MVLDSLPVTCGRVLILVWRCEQRAENCRPTTLLRYDGRPSSSAASRATTADNHSSARPTFFSTPQVRFPSSAHNSRCRVRRYHPHHHPRTRNRRATGEDVYRVFVENTNYRKANRKGRGASSNGEAAAVGSAFVGRSSAPCALVFVEPMTWMLESLGADELKKSEGTFYCPKCKSRIGSWNWQGTCTPRIVHRFIVFSSPLRSP